ncbi:hypothetical protein, partial [Enterococcus faecium]|uniref:hypothetical protein n=1 Tax=Enterococcus faecium TaxID=1352 RepID=UPI00211F2AE6
MKLEDKKVILKKIKRLPDQIDGYTICSFKKDRSIKAYTQNTEKGIIYFLHEEGYDTQTFMSVSYTHLPLPTSYTLNDSAVSVTLKPR